MEFKIIALIGLLVFAAGAAFTQSATQEAQQYQVDTRALYKNIHNNEGDLRKNVWDAAHDQRDLHDGDASGAKYWRRQAKDEGAEIAHDERDLAHSRSDLHNDKIRSAKDFKVRHHDAGKVNTPSKKH